ncbi:MAG: hypothetical protein JXR73_20135 [Candidatus Omnitrophica bacterium]|nr:hypothetical protein [Candidatus Omnitrophota bacterium]
MRKIRIAPGETLPLMLQEYERTLIFNETLLISEELEKKLRFAVMEGENLVVQLNLDEADELAGAVAAEANHCQNKKKQKRWDRLFHKIHGLLETYTDEDEAPQSFEDFLDAHFPQELADQIRSTVQSREFGSIEELNAVMSEVMTNHNRLPQDDMGGLSPEQVHHLLDFDWDDSRSAFHLNQAIPIEEILNTPIMHDIRAFLGGIIEEGGSIKTTSSGNLNRQFVQDMMEAFNPPSEFIAWTFQYKNTLNEDDAIHIHLVRVLAICAGLIRKHKSAFNITKKGKEYAHEAFAVWLYVHLFKTQFRKFDLAYLDGTPQNQPLQDAIAYSFYAIGKRLQDWKKPEDISEQITLPIVQEYVYEYKDLDIQVQMRILEPLVRFGLLETRALPKEEKKITRDYEYRKTPLYDQFFRFKL